MREKKYVARRQHRYAAPLGAIFLILALIGAVTVIVASINFTGKILDNQRDKTNFEKIITPAIIFDPMTFDDVSKADPEFLRESSMWSALLSNDRQKYSYDESGMLLLPASDVDVAASSLYGDSVKLEHTSFGDYEVTYVYDEQLKAYHVPVMGQTGLYTPRVDKIIKNGDVYQLRVGYIPPSDLWMMKLSGEKVEPSPDKYMMYEMKKVKNTYSIVAIKELSEELKQGVNIGPETVSSSSHSNSAGTPSGSSTGSSSNPSSSSGSSVDPSMATQG